MIKKYIKNQNKGFTLIELIVSLGLFTIVIMITTSAMLSMADLNSKVKTMRTAMDNLSLALESMSRDIRMGSVYTCNPSIPVSPLLSYGGVGTGCADGASVIAFFSQDSKIMVYRLNGTTVQRSKNGGNTFLDITSANIEITKLKFYVLGAGAGKDQPHVVISISGVTKGSKPSSFTVQTTVTQILPK